MKRAIVLVLVVTMVLSGCAGKGETASVATTSQAPSTVSVSPTDAVDTGVLRGTVTDEEQLPLMGVTVAIVKLDAQVTTDAAGLFELQGVPAGSHDVIASKLGYGSAARKVEIVPGETAETTFVLKPIAVIESYVQVLPHKALHHVGASQWLSWAVNLTQDASALCSGCQWYIRAAPPELMHIELDGAHTVPKPVPPKEWFWMFQKGYAVTGGFTESARGELSLPGQVTVAKDRLGKGVDVWWAQLLCDPEWVCFEEARDVYVSVFYGYEDLPEGYTARPV